MSETNVGAKRIYLAGGRDNEWRTLVERELGHLATFYNPFRDSRQGAVYEFTNDDLAGIAGSDFVIGMCDYHKYTGMALEFGYAHARGIPIYFVPYPGRVDAMMSAVAAATFTDIPSLIEFVASRVLA